MSVVNDGLDPLKWAKCVRSQCALDLLTAGAKDGDTRLAEILAGHVRDGVCIESGKLLMRWDGVGWVPIADDAHRESM